LLLGIGDPLVGRLLIWDALDGAFSEVSLKRDPQCPACGDGAPVEQRATFDMPTLAATR
jgi:molybdopterin/thiamine biosynthesis adenylyltransferase